MSPVIADVFRWGDGALQLLDYCDMTESSIEVATSFLVSDGRALALELHRARFLASAPDAQQFWDAAVASIPRQGDWFPRFESHRGGRLLFRLRSAPTLQRSLSVMTHDSADPRRVPLVKGPDLETMLRLRTEAQQHGADEQVILTGDGYVVETSQSALVWWRGSILCSPPDEFARVDSVTARSLLTLAGALGTDLHTEPVTPAELDGTEVWALNSLHGARIVTRWHGGPALAELPGRLALWRDRLTILRHELP